MKMPNLIIGTAMVLFSLLAPARAASVPMSFTHHGIIWDGDELMNGRLYFEARLLDTSKEPADTIALFRDYVTVQDGYYVITIPDIEREKFLAAGGNIELQLLINGDLLEPNLPVSSVPFALMAGEAAHAQGADAASDLNCQGCIKVQHLEDRVQNVISSTNESGAIINIAADAVGNTQLKTNAVDKDNIKKDAITTDKIANKTIKAEDIADSTISADKLNSSIQDKLARSFLVQRNKHQVENPWQKIGTFTIANTLLGGTEIHDALAGMVLQFVSRDQANFNGAGNIYVGFADEECLHGVRGEVLVNSYRKGSNSTSQPEFYAEQITCDKSKREYKLALWVKLRNYSRVKISATNLGNYYFTEDKTTQETQPDNLTKLNVLYVLTSTTLE